VSSTSVFKDSFQRGVVVFSYGRTFSCWLTLTLSL
jgi:hypothetical protein